MVDVVPGRSVPDLRCEDHVFDVDATFRIPQRVLASEDIERFCRTVRADENTPSRESLKRQCKTKLSRECVFYAGKELREKGAAVDVLDLGCGSGESKRYLNLMGFENVVAVDYWSSGAEFLVDAHRMPFDDCSFDTILSTATLEHLYNPFVAMREIARTLKQGGSLIATVSFWESWHGHSCFHFTPDGVLVLCESAGLVLEDLWSASGFLPSVAYHGFGSSRLRNVSRVLQRIFDRVKRFRAGAGADVVHRFHASGAFGFYARKK